MSDQVEIVDRRTGRRRPWRKGEPLRDGETAHFSMSFMDSALRDALLEKYRGGAIRVVDSAGLPGGHRPGFRHLTDAGLNDAAQVAYDERVKRLDYRTRARQLNVEAEQHDDDDDNGQPKLMQGDRQLALDQARAAADVAWRSKVERLAAAWKTR